MPYHDLNLPYTSQTSLTLANTLSFASELGYTSLVLSLSITGKLPSTLPLVPLPTIPNSSNVTLLTRLTLTISDTSSNHRLSTLTSTYNLLALRPTNEKTFQLACLSLDCDLISLDLSQRLPFILKFKTVAAALQRGVRFEICYSPGITGGTDARRNVITGATALIRATRGRGIVIGSEARGVLGLRAPHDVMNLLQVWGLGQERGKEALCEEAARVVRLAALKRESYRGVVKVMDGGWPEKTAQVQEEKNEQEVSKKSTFHATSGDTNGVNGVKRTASTASLNPPPTSTEEKPLSKRELKRRAKKARLEPHNDNRNESHERKSNKKSLNDSNTIPFPIKHESLSASTVSKKS